MTNADTDRAALEQEAAAHERRRLDSLVAGDRSGLAALMSEDCVVIHGSGVKETKAEFLGIFDRMKIASLDQLETSVRIFGEDMAVIISTTEMRSRTVASPPQDILIRHHQTTVWRKEAGRWQFNTMHNTRIP